MIKRPSGNQTFQQAKAKATTAETEVIFIEIGLEELLRQAMICAQDERLSVADHDMQPVKQAGIGIIISTPIEDPDLK